MVERWKQWARQLKGLVYALVYAYRDPRTPWYARVLAICVVAYALSPIDLIPDPIPVLGYLDDLLLIPLGVALVVKLLPAGVWTDAQTQATRELCVSGPMARIAAGVIVVLWLGLALVA
ncbi:MAG: YkvA family protein, partial [Chloroflexota bacterium]|nr:YkvA family protein [Chloroflexota bacterium]